jgi:hypothetical protein
MDVTQSVRRSGFGDPQLRFAVNLIGGPALTPQQFRTRTPQTTLGASLTVLCPYGEYLPSKLINIGTNRWAFKPELGLSHPAGKWSFELYAGVWFFTDNTDFFGGHVRTQNPLASYQTHVIYNVNPRTWAAFDFTYYSGGQTTLDGERKDDRQNNTRGGLTFAVPITPHQSIKASWANGAHRHEVPDDRCGLAVHLVRLRQTPRGNLGRAYWTKGQLTRPSGQTSIAAWNSAPRTG